MDEIYCNHCYCSKQVIEDAAAEWGECDTCCEVTPDILTYEEWHWVTV